MASPVSLSRLSLTPKSASPEQLYEPKPDCTLDDLKHELDALPTKFKKNGNVERISPVPERHSPSPHDFCHHEVVQVALVAAGSFNPPTYMHLKMFELGRDAVISHGFYFLGAYISPANDGYGKPGLVSAEHRLRMCQLAVEETPFIRVDPWEALQPSFQRTINVLAHIKDELCLNESMKDGMLRVMLLCGADLLESFTIPGVWVPEQMENILRDHGIVCISRGQKDLRKIIMESDIIAKYQGNIIVIDDFNCDISSTMTRENLGKGMSIEHLTPPNVIQYIRENNLYNMNAQG